VTPAIAPEHNPFLPRLLTFPDSLN